jgi:hypothetical protein
MPSESKAQHNLMEMVAHGGKPDMKGPPVKVAKEFLKADKKLPFSASKEKAKVEVLRKPKLPEGMPGMEGEEGGM